MYLFRESDEEIKLVQLRNPWGNDKEWNQGWSDKDTKWDTIRPDEKEKFYVGKVSNVFLLYYILLYEFDLKCVV